MKARVKGVRIIIPLWPEVAALLQEAAAEPQAARQWQLSGHTILF